MRGGGRVVHVHVFLRLHPDSIHRTRRRNGQFLRRRYGLLRRRCCPAHHDTVLTPLLTHPLRPIHANRFSMTHPCPCPLQDRGAGPKTKKKNGASSKGRTKKLGSSTRSAPPMRTFKPVRNVVSAYSSSRKIGKGKRYKTVNLKSNGMTPH